MRRQAYSSGHTVLAESLVRACTARYVLAHDGEDAARREIKSQQARAFLWTGELFDVLGKYGQDREKYLTLDSFMPRVVAYFNDLSPRVGAMEAARPKVLSVTPSNGAKDVDPAVNQIVIRFNRPMTRDHYSVMKSKPELWPEVVKAGFDETGLVFTLDVRLKPGRDYEFSLNSDAGGNFTSAEGMTLDAFLIHFHTK